MSVTELNRKQILQLKQNYIIQNNFLAYWSDLADAEFLVPDSVIEEIYRGCEFTEDDFYEN